MLRWAAGIDAISILMGISGFACVLLGAEGFVNVLFGVSVAGIFTTVGIKAAMGSGVRSKS